MSVFSGPEVVNDGLVLNLDAANTRSYPGSGTAWTDLSGNNNSATLTNPSYNSSNGGSIVFNGSTTSGLISGFSLLAPLTICAWINKSANVAWSSIIDRYGSETLDSVSLGFDNTNGQKLMYMFNATSATNWSNKVYGNSVIGTNIWYHVAVSASESSATFYVNGVSDGTSAISQVAQTGNFYLGLNLPGGDEYFNGQIGYVQIYNIALTAAEMSQNFNATRGRYGI